MTVAMYFYMTQNGKIDFNLPYSESQEMRELIFIFNMESLNKKKL